jgi:hypothetical protein
VVPLVADVDLADCRNDLLIAEILRLPSAVHGFVEKEFFDGWGLVCEEFDGSFARWRLDAAAWSQL